VKAIDWWKLQQGDKLNSTIYCIKYCQ